MPRPRTPFTTLRTEGAILPADLLQRVADGDAGLGGLTPEAYHPLSRNFIFNIASSIAAR